MTYGRKPTPRKIKDRIPVIAAVVGAGAGFVVGYIVPLVLMWLGAIDADNADFASCCMAPLLTIAGGVGGFIYGRDLERNSKQNPPPRR